jgi:hypothetical protein
MQNKFSGCCDNIGCHLNQFNCNMHEKWGSFCNGLNCFKCDIGNKFSGCFSGCGGWGGGCCK